MIIRREGGYCYQISEFLKGILLLFGFKVITLEAQTIFPGTIFDPVNDISNHCALLVSIDNNDYLIDVGLGKSSI
jgi:arylamine N-acetyltransferase